MFRSSFVVVVGGVIVTGCPVVTGNVGACTVLVVLSSSSKSVRCGHSRVEWKGTWFACFNDPHWIRAIGTP